MTAEASTDPTAGSAGLAHAVSTDEEITFKAQYPWRRQEIASIVVIPVVGVVLSSVPGLAIPWFIGALSIFAGLYMIYVGWHRKTKSSVVAVWSGSVLTVRSRGPLKESSVNLATVTVVSTKKFGSDVTLLLAGDAGAVRVPLRLLDDARMVRLVRAVVASSNSTADARAVLRRDGRV